jgi:hypothetical protein
MLDGSVLFMALDLLITKPIQKDVKAVYSVFDITIREAFNAEGLGSWDEEFEKKFPIRNSCLPIL